MEQHIDVLVSEVGSRDGIPAEPLSGCASQTGATKSHVPAYRSRSAA